MHRGSGISGVKCIVHAPTECARLPSRLCQLGKGGSSSSSLQYCINCCASELTESKGMLPVESSDSATMRSGSGVGSPTLPELESRRCRS